MAETITRDFWTQWAHKSTYRGARPEQIQRSLLCLKLLTYQPTGAIIAAPTLSLPESIGGGRNWVSAKTFLQTPTVPYYTTSVLPRCLRMYVHTSN